MKRESWYVVRGEGGRSVLNLRQKCANKWNSGVETYSRGPPRNHTKEAEKRAKKAPKRRRVHGKNKRQRKKRDCTRQKWRKRPKRKMKIEETNKLWGPDIRRVEIT